jgi:hypothetical protein
MVYTIADRPAQQIAVANGFMNGVVQKSDIYKSQVHYRYNNCQCNSAVTYYCEHQNESNELGRAAQQLLLQPNHSVRGRTKFYKNNKNIS